MEILLLENISDKVCLCESECERESERRYSPGLMGYFVSNIACFRLCEQQQQLVRTVLQCCSSFQGIKVRDCSTSIFVPSYLVNNTQ